jgi:UDP-GlcNAc:undecaprenyl-phosphate GlcNAc-1-phosphate transferase
MGIITNIFLTPVVSLLMVLLLTPLVRKFALKFQLVDNPNARKLHKLPIPLIGGILVFLSSFIALAFNIEFAGGISQLNPLLIGASIILIMGVVDDKVDLKANHKLLIQLGLSYFIFLSGIKIDSLYGVFGIYELPEHLQFLVTVLIITGTVNAFNLTDGIDGLAAGLAIIAFFAFTIIAFSLNKINLAILFLSILGALIGFLKYNLGKSNKIFMGDAGSLFLGFILVVSGIMLIQAAENTPKISETLPTVIAVLLIPTIDSLRVYWTRIRNGKSPFKADKTHLHHLLITLRLKHSSATMMIVVFTVLFLGFATYLTNYLSITFIIISLISIFLLISNTLTKFNEVNKWRKKLKDLEKK